jgi:hypothetical protein
MKILIYIANRLDESSTWQAIGFLVTFFGSKYGLNYDVGTATAFGASLSAMIKMIFPDQFKDH